MITKSQKKNILESHNFKNLFQYQIIRSSKRKRSICLSVKDSILVVRAPLKAKENKILELISEKESWILKRLQESKNKKPTSSSLKNNSSIYFLGKKYSVQIIQSKLLKNKGFCEVDENNFYIHIPMDAGKRVIKNIVDNWFIEQAKEIFKEKTQYFAEKYNFKYNRITIKKQKTVWGSCSSHNNLNFNYKAILASESVVNYLVIHELCHTVYRNHSKNFWLKVATIIPHYKLLQQELKKLEC